MEIEVRSDIPMPVEDRGKGTVAALRKLVRVGQSVFLPVRHSALGPAARESGLTGKYAARTVEGGIRVWRIKE